MKKFLLILLIAVAASVSVEFDGTELNGWFKDWIKKVAKKVWDFIKSLPERLKGIVNWLKENGWWDKIVDLVEKYGAPKAVEFCQEKAPGFLKGFCQEAVNKIIEWLRK